MPVDDRTTNLNLAKPAAENLLSEDVERLRAALDAIDAAIQLRAPLASPELTGNPTAPTPAADNETTSIATTEFVLGQAGTANPVADGSASPGTSKRFARGDHRHPVDTSRAPVESPTFTGEPAAPTPSAGTASNRLATTRFVSDGFVPLGRTVFAAGGLQVNESPSATLEGNITISAAALEEALALVQATADVAAPPSTIAFLTRSTAPAGWLKANGAAVSRTTYADLFAAIGTTYGAGNGTTTFNLPDLRGEFLRGWDDGRGLDVGRGFATIQYGQNLAHGHGVYDPHHAHSVHDPGHAHTYIRPNGGAPVNVGGQFTSGALDTFWSDRAGTGIAIYGAGTGIFIQSNGGTEARPRNVSLLVVIKF